MTYTHVLKRLSFQSNKIDDMQTVERFIQRLIITITAIMLTTACKNTGQDKTASEKEIYKPGTFGYDLQFLQGYDSLILLRSPEGSAQLIVSAKYQGKVFTSTAQGNDGFSFGWVNYKAFDGPADLHMNAYGGENRLWLGPEGGPFSLYFKPGEDMVFDNWKTPAAFDTEPWEVEVQTAHSVTMKKDMSLVNYRGTPLRLSVKREIAVSSADSINKRFGLPLDAAVNAVGYQTTNTLINKGSQPWTAETGMPCIWVLDMMKNTDSTVIVVPIHNPDQVDFSKVATTDYFGEIPADRLVRDDQHLFFKADGKSRGKIGVKPAHTDPVIGSYDPLNGILTLAVFEPEASSRYLNQEWDPRKSPFTGDAVNAYNDGPLADGSQMGPFYEIESVSPAAFLRPQESLVHRQSVYHFTGDKKSLDMISKRFLGVSLNDITNAFK